VKVVKNKLAPPFKEVEFDIIFGKGISKEGDIIDMGAEIGLLEKTGSWYAYGETRLGQGRENAKEYLRRNPELARELEEKIYAHYGLR
jgi:recombination protein RecA